MTAVGIITEDKSEETERILDEISAALAGSLKEHFAGEMITPALMHQIKFMVMETLVKSAGYDDFDVIVEPVQDSKDSISVRPGNMLTAYVMFALGHGMRLPDPRNLQDPWETDIGTVRFDDEKKQLYVTYRMPLEHINITFKV